MLSSILAVLSLLATATPTFSLSIRDLALPNLPNATNLLGHIINETNIDSPAANLSAPGRINCMPTQGNAPILESCENAWLKIPHGSNEHVFRHRYEAPPPSTMYGFQFSIQSLLSKKPMPLPGLSRAPLYIANNIDRLDSY
jgi:hypothetical protein